MKKLLLSLVVVCFSLSHLNAQEDMLVKGDKVVNIGIGLGSSLGYYGLSSVGLPFVNGSAEFGIVDGLIQGKGSVGVGGMVGFRSRRYDYIGGDYVQRYFTLGARGAFHYPLVENLDTYAGLMLGFDIYSDNDPGYNYDATGFASYEFIGARYYFSENFAAMAELGFGVTVLNLGIALKF